MSHNHPMRVDDLTPGDAAAAAPLLAAAFADDPGYAFVSPPGPARRPHLERLFAVHLDIDRDAGALALAARRDGRLAGLAVWFPPGARAGSVWDWLGHAGRLGPVLRRPLCCWRGLRLQAAVERWRPKDPGEAYLKLLAVRPEEHGRGTGTALLEAVAARAGEDGGSLYLETATAANAAYYGRRGFARLDDLAELGLPRLYRFRRGLGRPPAAR